jgi:hypothetical protein
MPAKNPSGGGGMGRGGSGNGGGGGGKPIKPKPVKPKPITNIKTKKPLTPAQIEARKLKIRVDRIKKSEAAEDLKNRNLNNFNKRFDRKPRAAVTRKNNSPFGPVAAGIVKTKPKPKGKK